MLASSILRSQTADSAARLYDSSLPDPEAVDRHLHEKSPSFLDTEVLGWRDVMFSQTRKLAPKLINGRQKQKIMSDVVAGKRVSLILVMWRGGPGFVHQISEAVVPIQAIAGPKERLLGQSPGPCSVGRDRTVTVIECIIRHPCLAEYARFTARGKKT